MSKKLIIILIIIWVAVIGAVTATVLFIKPGLLVEDKTFYDERTGKSFDIVDGKVQFYLPIKMSSVSDNEYENFDIYAKYDSKARLIEKEYQAVSASNESFVRKNYYTYDIDGRLDHITEENVTNDVALDWDVTYSDKGNVKTIVDEGKVEVVDGQEMYTYGVYYEYNNNGLLVDDYSMFTPDGREKGNRYMYSYTYDDSNHINYALVVNDNDSTETDYKYKNGLLEEAVLEGTQSGGGWHVSQAISRKNGHIDEIEMHDVESSNVTVVSDRSCKYEYDNGHLTFIDYKDHFAQGDRVIDDNNTFEFEYDGDELSSAVWKNESGENELSFEHENGQLTEIRKKNADGSATNVRIEYELFEMDKDDWEAYLDSYYSYRYEVLHDRLMIYDIGYSGLFELEEGYFDQYSEYYMFMFNGDYSTSRWFNWTALPKVLGREYYKLGD